MQPLSKPYLSSRTLVILLLALLLLRVLLAYYLPLIDTTEARYGEIARKMWQLQDWITPWHGDNDPFWGKPPLAFWLSALSMGLFGVNEFAVRLPSLILSIGSIALVMHFAATQKRNLHFALTCGLVLSASSLFFLFSATMMTDAALVFCITLSQVSFWYAITDRGRLWGYLFFIGLGFGLLAKGPLAVVLVGIPIFFWVLIRNQWLVLWRKLPWILGTLLAALIAIPWYVMAELKTPGFFNYFIIGEHFGRFLDPGWEGDRYGWAHETMRGAIWGYFLVGIFPWCLALLYLSKTGQLLRQCLSRKPEQLGADSLFYIFCWMLASLLFFSLSRNIIMPYVLPALPAAALLLTYFLYSISDQWRSKWVLSSSAFTLLLALIMLALLWQPKIIGKLNTFKPVVAELKAEDYAHLAIWKKRNFSAEFYSGNQVHYFSQVQHLADWLATGKPLYLVIREKELAEIAPYNSQLSPWQQLKIDNKDYVILHNKVN